jgi:Domain of unknown function (DUF4438)
MSGLRPVAVNLLGVVEHPEFGGTPYRVDSDGRSYVPAGDGGIVLGPRLGESVFAWDADHAAPGVCLVHPDQAARHALAAYSCIGNQVVVRTGHAAGARGAVLGQRGEQGRVIAWLAPEDMARLRPSDQVAVRACGQGWRPPGFPGEVAVLNLDPGALETLPVSAAEADGTVTAAVRMIVPSKLAGNGIGRPSVSWDLDLQLRAPARPDEAGGDLAGEALLLGDLVAVSDLDTRYNMGYRRGWLTVGLVVHGGSPLPGHGPGMTPILTGPGDVLRARPDGAAHAGLTEDALRRLTAAEVELQ